MYLSRCMNILYLMGEPVVNTVNASCELNKRHESRISSYVPKQFL